MRYDHPFKAWWVRSGFACWDETSRVRNTFFWSRCRVAGGGHTASGANRQGQNRIRSPGYDQFKSCDLRALTLAAPWVDRAMQDDIVDFAARNADILELRVSQTVQDRSQS